MLGINWHHYMDFGSYKDVVDALEGYKSDIIASGYKPSDRVFGCWERKGEDGEPICHAARIIDRGDIERPSCLLPAS